VSPQLLFLVGNSTERYCDPIYLKMHEPQRVSFGRSAANIPPITSSGTNSITVSAAGANIAITNGNVTQSGGATGVAASSPATNGTWTFTGALSGSNNISVTSTGTTSTPFKVETVQPTIVMNFMIKR
jgi:hypothetical protein